MIDGKCWRLTYPLKTGRPHLPTISGKRAMQRELGGCWQIQPSHLLLTYTWNMAPEGVNIQKHIWIWRLHFKSVGQKNAIFTWSWKPLQRINLLPANWHRPIQVQTDIMMDERLWATYFGSLAMVMIGWSCKEKSERPYDGSKGSWRYAWDNWYVGRYRRAYPPNRLLQGSRAGAQPWSKNEFLHDQALPFFRERLWTLWAWVASHWPLGTRSLQLQSA